jgi:hypothetical protein
MSRRLLLVACATLASGAPGLGCLKVWEVQGSFACALDAGCPEGQECDDGLCCRPGGSPACPTLPWDGGCASGVGATTSYRDEDGDGAGNPDAGRRFCSRPLREAWAALGNDCDDRSAARGPTASERCNALDDDCDGDIDEGNVLTTWYVDADGDGFGDDCEGCTIKACEQPRGYVARAGDCGPLDEHRHPGAVEQCDNVDNNCNGQRDDPPYLALENPGLDEMRVPCDAGAAGQCAEGGLQCVATGTDGGREVRCVPRRAASPDNCGNGLDEDCSGEADDPPGCGGPPSLVNVTGGTYRVLALPLSIKTNDAGSQLPGRCLAGLGEDAGARPMGWLNPVWVATGKDAGTSVHLWLVEAPHDSWWDLSAPGLMLGLELRTTWVGGASDGGNPWADLGGGFRSPVVTLCGSGDQGYVRWVAPANVPLSAGPYSVQIPVDGVPSNWTREGADSGFNLRMVNRVEIAVSPRAFSPTDPPIAFQIRFSANAGFRRDAGIGP